MTTNRCEPPVLGTIAKSGRVLALFTPRHPEWGVTEVARSLQMPKSGAHSQLSALTQIGVLRRTATSRYRLGWWLISLSHTLLETSGFRRQAHRELAQLVAHTGKACSAWIAVRDGGEVISIDQAGGSESQARFLTAAGRRLPAHSTAAGKLLLAFSPPDELEFMDIDGFPAAHGGHYHGPRRSIRGIAASSHPLDRVGRRGDTRRDHFGGGPGTRAGRLDRGRHQYLGSYLVARTGTLRP